VTSEGDEFEQFVGGLSEVQCPASHIAILLSETSFSRNLQ